MTLREIANSFSDGCPLSHEEMAVLVELAEGWRARQIASRLELKPQTVYSITYRIRDKLGVVDRAQAVMVAFLAGWIVEETVVADDTETL